MGQSIIVPFGHLIRWANANHPDIDAARAEYDGAEA
jgi:hypothetical protein